MNQNSTYYDNTAQNSEIAMRQVIVGAFQRGLQETGVHAVTINASATTPSSLNE